LGDNKDLRAHRETWNGVVVLETIHGKVRQPTPTGEVEGNRLVRGRNDENS